MQIQFTNMVYISFKLGFMKAKLKKGNSLIDTHSYINSNRHTHLRVEAFLEKFLEENLQQSNIKLLSITFILTPSC